MYNATNLPKSRIFSKIIGIIVAICSSRKHRIPIPTIQPGAESKPTHHKSHQETGLQKSAIPLS